MIFLTFILYASKFKMYLGIENALSLSKTGIEFWTRNTSKDGRVEGEESKKTPRSHYYLGQITLGVLLREMVRIELHGGFNFSKEHIKFIDTMIEGKSYRTDNAEGKLKVFRQDKTYSIFGDFDIRLRRNALLGVSILFPVLNQKFRYEFQPFVGVNTTLNRYHMDYNDDLEAMSTTWSKEDVFYRPSWGPCVGVDMKMRYDCFVRLSYRYDFIKSFMLKMPERDNLAQHKIEEEISFKPRYHYVSLGIFVTCS